MHGTWIRSDSALSRMIRVGSWLVLPVSLLLFLQWPLRDLVHRGSPEANDLAQWLFALYIAVALTCATRRDAHPRIAAWRRLSPSALQTCSALCLLPWAGFILVTGASSVWRSVLGLEAFPDTYNPGYFLVKIAAWLLALLVAGQAVLDLTRRREG